MRAVSGSPHRAAQHRVARRENVLVVQPGARPRQQRGRALEPERFVFEEPRHPFAASGIERTQAQVLADAVLMVGDRLLPPGVGVDRLGGGSQLQGGEPQDLPVNLQGRLLGKSAEHTHEGDLVGEPRGHRTIARNTYETSAPGVAGGALWRNRRGRKFAELDSGEHPLPWGDVGHTGALGSTWLGNSSNPLDTRHPATTERTAAGVKGVR